MKKIALFVFLLFNAFLTRAQSTTGYFHLYFATDKYIITTAHTPTLDSLTRFIKDKTVIRIYIDGNTDNVASHQYNVGLSDRRARHIQQYLIDKGCKQEIISITALAETSPVRQNTTPEGKQMNRRVDISIVYEQAGSLTTETITSVGKKEPVLNDTIHQTAIVSNPLVPKQEPVAPVVAKTEPKPNTPPIQVAVPVVKDSTHQTAIVSNPLVPKQEPVVPVVAKTEPKPNTPPIQVAVPVVKDSTHQTTTAANPVMSKQEPAVPVVAKTEPKPNTPPIQVAVPVVKDSTHQTTTAANPVVPKQEPAVPVVAKAEPKPKRTIQIIDEDDDSSLRTETKPQPKYEVHLPSDGGGSPTNANNNGVSRNGRRNKENKETKKTVAKKTATKNTVDDNKTPDYPGGRGRGGGGGGGLDCLGLNGFDKSLSGDDTTIVLPQGTRCTFNTMEYKAYKDCLHFKELYSDNAIVNSNLTMQSDDSKSLITGGVFVLDICDDLELRYPVLVRVPVTRPLPNPTKMHLSRTNRDSTWDEIDTQVHISTIGAQDYMDFCMIRSGKRNCNRPRPIMPEGWVTFYARKDLRLVKVRLLINSSVIQATPEFWLKTKNQARCIMPVGKMDDCVEVNAMAIDAKGDTLVSSGCLSHYQNTTKKGYIKIKDRFHRIFGIFKVYERFIYRGYRFRDSDWVKK